MGLKKLGFKAGSWLGNAEPKSKRDTRNSKITNINSSTSLSTFEDNYGKESPVSAQEPFFASSPGSAPGFSREASNDSFRSTRRQSALPSAKALFKMFSSSPKKDGHPVDQDELRRSALSASTSQLNTKDHYQSQSSLLSPSFSSTPYFSPKLDRPNDGSTSEHVAPINEYGEVFPSPQSQVSFKPFTTAESAPYTISVIDPQSRPRTFPNLSLSDESLAHSRPTPPPLERDRSHSFSKPTLAAGSQTSPPTSPHRRSTSVNPSQLNPKHPASLIREPSIEPRGLARHASTNSRYSQSRSGLASTPEKPPEPASEPIPDLKPVLDRLTSQLAKAERERDAQLTKVSELQAEVTRHEQALESERSLAREELEKLLKLQHEHQASQQELQRNDDLHKALELKVQELQSHLHLAREEIAVLSRQSRNQEELLSERVQLRNWLTEEKVRHNEVREDYAEAKAKLRTEASRINHLEALIQDQNERIKAYENREATSNENSMKEIVYYQEQLADAVRSRDEIRDENERNKDQIRILRSTMEQLLKAGVSPDVNRVSSPVSSIHDHYSPISHQPELRYHSPYRDIDDKFSFSSVKDSGHSASSPSQSNPSVYSEELVSSPSEVLSTSPNVARHGLGSDRRRTFGVESQVTSVTPVPPVCSPKELPQSSPRNSVLEPALTQALPSDESSTQFWDAKLKALLKDKERTEQEYGRIPTKVNKSMRARKEELENRLDQLDSEISGARSRIRTLVI